MGACYGSEKRCLLMFWKWLLMHGLADTVERMSSQVANHISGFTGQCPPVPTPQCCPPVFTPVLSPPMCTVP